MQSKIMAGQGRQLPSHGGLIPFRITVREAFLATSKAVLHAS